MLPTGDHLARMGKVEASNCLYSTAHLSTCSYRLMTCMSMSSYLPGITADELVALKFKVSESLELPLVLLLSSCPSYIGQMGRNAGLEVCRAELLAKLVLLRDT